MAKLKTDIALVPNATECSIIQVLSRPIPHKDVLFGLEYLMTPASRFFNKKWIQGGVGIDPRTMTYVTSFCIEREFRPLIKVEGFLFKGTP
jgi:hypothetical protein